MRHSLREGAFIIHVSLRLRKHQANTLYEVMYLGGQNVDNDRMTNTGTKESRRRNCRRRYPAPVRCLIGALLSLLTCATREPPPLPEPPPPETVEEPEREARPDVIMIAVRFVEYEGCSEELDVEAAYIKSQDHFVYLVGFPRKKTPAGRGGEALVKVHKMDGFAEWEEY
jgi:hypothetical protein